MAKAGRAAQALATAAIGSFVAGTIGTALLALFAPSISRVRRHSSARRPTSRSCCSPSSRSPRCSARPSCAGSISLFLGLAIGIDRHRLPDRPVPRDLRASRCSADGIDIVVIAVAIFALGEALWVAAHLRRRPVEVIPVGRPWMGKQDWKRSWKPWLRGTAYGFPFGALPAGGAELPTFLSYITEKKLSKHPEEFGKGAIEGVAGPEAANNASAAGTLVPMLSLGLPTNATAAVMLDRVRVRTASSPARRLFDQRAAADLDADRQPVHRQLAAAAAQPAAGAAVGQAAAHPAAVPVRRHPVLRHARRVRRQPAAVRPGAAAGARACSG